MYLHFAFEQICLLSHKRDEKLDALDGIEAFKHLLLVDVLDEQIGGYEVRKKRGIFDSLRGGQHIVADRGEHSGKALGLAHNCAAVRLRFDAFLVREGDCLADKLRADVIREAMEFGHGRARVALGNYAHIALGCLDRLLDLCHRAHSVERGGGELFT